MHEVPCGWTCAAPHDPTALQVEALSELKQYQEALQALESAAQQDKAFATSKEMKLMQRQLQAVTK